MQIEETKEIKNIGPLTSSGTCDRILIGCLLIGLAVFIIGLFVDPRRAWFNYLIEFFFFTCLGLGGLVFTAVQYAASANWSVSVRRIAEGLWSYLPVSFVMLVILFIGLPYIYEWSQRMPLHYFTYTKEVYLSSLWFLVREILFFGLWILFGWLIVGNSLKQDKGDYPTLTRSNKKLSLVFLIVFGYSFTFSSMDLLMSLDEHFYSTIFGVYCFSGLFLSGLAITSILVITFKRMGYLENAVDEKHLHDLGTWMMAFSVFMVYIGFSQYMLIWYADLPHEITYLIPRSKNGWQFVFILLPILKWIVPFIVLMPSKNRTNPRVIVGVAIAVLLGQWLDIYWMVIPTYSESFMMVGWMEVGIFLGFMGLFGLTVRRFYKKHQLLASGDPGLKTCVNGRYLHV